MAKLNTPAAARAAIRSAITTTGQAATTAQGGQGFLRDPKSELVMLAVNNMVGEKTFYESAADRDPRFDSLVRHVAPVDGQWMLEFIRWLRGDAGMRTASVVAAIEAVHARLHTSLTGEQNVRNRQLIDAACQRADEPDELFAGWIARYGRTIPICVKRGLSDAIVRLYTERNLLRYDGSDKTVRFGDVIDMVNPQYHKTPPAAEHDPSLRGAFNDDLMRYALDRRHNRDNPIPESLHIIRANAALRASATEDLRVLLKPEALRAAGMTWKDVLALAGKRLDRKQLWEALIPTMNVGALVGNLRAFDEAKVSDACAQIVMAKISDPAEVRASRIMPLRFLAAFRQAPSLRWAPALEAGLQATLSNVPVLRGRTLILLDVSGSMADRMAGRSKLNRADAAGLFAAALAVRCEKPTFVVYNNYTARLDVTQGESVLRVLDRKIPGPSGGTLTAAAAKAWYAGHDQVLCFTDEQVSYYGKIEDQIPDYIPLVTFNVAGYKVAQSQTGTGKRFAIGGLTDAMFSLLPAMIAGLGTTWPWEHKN